MLGGIFSDYAGGTCTWGELALDFVCEVAAALEALVQVVQVGAAQLREDPEVQAHHAQLEQPAPSEPEPEDPQSEIGQSKEEKKTICSRVVTSGK